MPASPHPHFLVVGAQKAGTTTLHHLLGAHPRIFLPPGKELQYFSLHADRPWAWYQQHFDGVGPDQICGEITPYYLFHPEAPARIRAALPRVLLVVMLRDPVERTLSQYFHARRHGFETLPLEESLEAEPSRLAGAEIVLKVPGASHSSHQRHSYVARSRYEQQLGRFESWFPRHQILALQSEMLLGNGEEAWRQLLDFLQVPLRARGKAVPRENAGRQEAQTVAPSIREWLRRELAPTAVAMRERYGFDWGW